MNELTKPGYLHVIINHLPIIGLAMGIFAMAIALFLRSRAAQITALAVVTFAATSGPVVFITGEKAYKPIRKLTDDAGSDYLDEHMDRAEQTIGLFYALAILALAGQFVPIWWPKTGTPIFTLTLLLAIISLGAAIYVAQPAGKIRHSEFRIERTLSTTPAEP
jgi:hypothetical protein